MFSASKSQLNAYRKRKKLLFKRMQFGTISMCIIIIFLVWLQDWLPKKNRQFWNRGTSSNFKLCSLDQVRLDRVSNSTKKNAAAKWASGLLTRTAQTLTSVKNFNFVIKITTVRTQLVAISVAAGTVTKLLELSALTLTSVTTRISAQKILCAKIVPEVTAVSVTLVSKGIFARIQMSVLLATLAMLTPHVRTLREAICVFATLAFMAME